MNDSVQRTWWGGVKRVEEDRALPAGGAVAPSQDVIAYSPYSDAVASREVTTATALTISDAYACVRLLADSVSSLPLHVYRKTAAGRVSAGDQSRAVQLLRRPSPGSTGVDLISQMMVHLNIYGEVFLAKWRRDNEIVQLGLISPESVQVELRGQRVIYTLSTVHGETEHGPDDILHVKGMSLDGLRGMSPVTQCRVALGLSSSLQKSARQFFAHGSKPSGVLTVPGGNRDAMDHLAQQWSARHGGVENMHRVAVLSGDVTFTPVGFTASDNEFLGQRELSTREVARIFRVPAWAIDGATGDSLTYSNALEQNRSLVTHSLRPWLVRIEQALSNDTDLCPASTYCQFELDGLLRADSKTRAETYTAALDATTGWLTRREVRELEDLPPEPAAPTPPTETTP